MPFIDKQSRLALSKGKSPETFGEMCYVHYAYMVKQWQKEKRWTTAHRIYADARNRAILLTPDDAYAQDLAWQVFFNIHVMRYERKMRKKNGDIK